MGNRLGGKARMIDRAQEHEPGGSGPGDTREKPGGRKSSHEAGPEKHYSKEAWEGNPNDYNPISKKPGGEVHRPTGPKSEIHSGADLGHAMKELHRQHPHKHHEHGPHHGKEHHIRHEPLHGLHPKSGHGRKK